MYVCRFLDLFLGFSLLPERHQCRDARGRPVALFHIEIVDKLDILYGYTHHMQQVVVEDPALVLRDQRRFIAARQRICQHIGVFQGPLCVDGCRLVSGVQGMIAVEYTVEDGVHRDIPAGLPLGLQPIHVGLQGVWGHRTPRLNAQQLSLKPLAIVVGGLGLGDDLVEHLHHFFWQIIFACCLILFPKSSIANGFRIDAEHCHNYE